jgi:hypothetical protein
MANDVEGAEGFGAFRAAFPACPHALEQGVEGGRCAMQDVDRLIKPRAQNSSPCR